MESDIYSIRRAQAKDIPFLVETIIAAEKSNSDKIGLANLSGMSEEEFKKILTNMLEEEIDGCEFSVSSFLIAFANNEPAAAVGGWIEGYIDDMRSNILKANLIGFCFPKFSIENLNQNAPIAAQIIIPREKMSLQIEYVYVHENHRGKGTAEALIKEHIILAKNEQAEIKKIQVQVFENNISAIKVYQKLGFSIRSVHHSNNERVLDFMPHNKKQLMEKEI